MFARLFLWVEFLERLHRHLRHVTTDYSPLLCPPESGKPCQGAVNPSVGQARTGELFFPPTSCMRLLAINVVGLEERELTAGFARFLLMDGKSL